MAIAGRLSNRHVNFENEKMRVDLAAQVMSRSVAEGIRTLSESYSEFADSEETIAFITAVNDTFDVLNSRLENCTGFKKPLSSANMDEYNALFCKTEELFSNLKIAQQKADKTVWTPVMSSINKTGFLGFVVDMHSFKGIFEKYVEETKEIDMLFGYRFSQDHLETFFFCHKSTWWFQQQPNGCTV